MARAYLELKKPDVKRQSETRDQIYCSNCDEWGDADDDWTAHDAYRHYRHERWVFGDNDTDYIFGEQCEDITVYEHDDCAVYYVNPEMKTENTVKDIWVCGICGYRSYDKEEARRCCT